MIGQRRYEPEAGEAADYKAVLARLGIERCVLVQPSFYGLDNGCQIAAMRIIGRERCRGVAVVDETISNAELQRLHDAGMRGVRFNLMSGGLPVSALETIAHRIADFGWHVQLFASAPAIEAIEARLRALPVATVIDHMGCPEKAGGVAQSGFQAVLRLLRDRVVWVKLAGAERLSALKAGFDDVVPFAQALIAAAPERVVWGMDWPPSRYFDTPPEPEDWVRLLLKYAPGAAARRAVLVDNPATLYGFPPVP